MILTLIVFFFITLIVYIAFARPYRKAENKRGLMIGSVKVGDVIYSKEGIKGVVQGVAKGEKFRVATMPDEMTLLIPFNDVKEVEGFDYKEVNKEYKKQLKEKRKSWK